jgi:RNA polymerase subunit RPABC4/transcription elongation factor Spt4
MQVKNDIQTALTAEIKIVPKWAWALAAAGFVGMQLLLNVVVAHQPGAPPAWGRVLLGLLTGVIFGCYLLFIGYVSGDARRRGMSPILWVCVAILIPNGLGIVLYFILRKPLSSACPQCGCAIQTGFSFCPQCNYKLSPSCPQCQRVIGGNYVYCPYCGTSLPGQMAM